MDVQPTDVDRRNTALPRLTTAQAAARLGVRPATLYAYVSRGLLVSARAERGGSTFDPLEVEAFAAARRRPAAASDGTPLLVLDSPLTEVRPGVVRYRGRDAADLARSARFEEAVGLLWASAPPALAADAPAAAAARRAADALGAAGLDRLRLALVAAASADPLRADLERGAVLAAGARAVSTMVDALPVIGEDPGPGAPLAARLRARLTAGPVDIGALRALDAALVLSLDHDLAVSTLAARVAASARADPYACVLAALGAFGGPLHGAAPLRATALLTETLESGDPHRALATAVARHGHVPGFGHVIHRETDPRAVALLDVLRPQPRFAAAVRAADLLAAIVRERLHRPANLDLALAALTVGDGLLEDAGVTVFAVGRTAGWTAHAALEYEEAPLRLRPTSRFTG